MNHPTFHNSVRLSIISCWATLLHLIWVQTRESFSTARPVAIFVISLIAFHTKLCTPRPGYINEMSPCVVEWVSNVQNYMYFLDDLEDNAFEYARRGCVSVSAEISRILGQQWAHDVLAHLYISIHAHMREEVIGDVSSCCTRVHSIH